jgi:hypothetical protein
LRMKRFLLAGQRVSSSLQYNSIHLIA